MKAIIMAGGQGTRLRPLTCNCPKPLIPMLGKPTIQYSIELLRNYGITDIGITLQYLSDEIIGYFGDGRTFNVNLRYFIESEPLGTAGSLKNAEDFLDETFIVLSGDAVTDINLKKAIKFHDKSSSIVTIILKEVKYPLDYGVVVTDENQKVVAFQEKPNWNEVLSDKVNTGIYIMDPEVLKFCPKNKRFDISKNLFPVLLRNNLSLSGFLTDSYWADMGKIEEYIKCSNDILDQNINVDLNVNEVKKGCFIGFNTTISKNAKIVPPVYIGSNCRIYSGAEIGPYSIIGDNTTVFRNSSIYKSIIFNDVNIGENSIINCALLGRGAQLESGVIVEENSIIGDRATLKARSIIESNVRIWPGKVIEENSLIKHHIINSNNSKVGLFYKNSIRGKIGNLVTVEFMAKLGNALGSELRVGDKVAISCNEHSASQMLKYSLFSGLISSGVEVYDLNAVIMPILRESVIFFQFNLAIFISIENEEVVIELLDKNGINVEKNFQRKIDNRIYYEEFRRVSSKDYKKVINVSDSGENYINNILNNFKKNNKKLKNFKVLLISDNEQVQNIFMNISKELGVICKHISKNNDKDSILSIIRKGKYNLAIITNFGGEKITLYNEKGEVLEDSQIDALKAFIILKFYNLKTMVIPINSSPVVEDIAKESNCKIVKSKKSYSYVLEQYCNDEECKNKDDIKEVFMVNIDNIRFVLSLIYYLASREISLSMLLSMFNNYYCYREEIDCPFYLKGKVMRELIGESKTMLIDLIEGIKMNYEKGYVLVTQDSDEPYCSVLAYGSDKNQLKEIKDNVVNKINSIINNKINNIDLK